MNFDNVTDAVWTATAIMAYNEYLRGIRSKSLSVANFYFKQPDILKEAKNICNNDVQNARTSQWYNACSP
ncbi:hypothetical protein HZF08_01805 [Paenibacillus sp. CGMCC 1.16610]|uniref:Uncharacterized protein n=1 Tax=Paenibacillus anseongense TaxID=2682845 RepID=A0ABW9U2S3_9BACL|nr:MULTISPECIES: hypothetical protein [Paenibacillus]MBA2937035.1 hypothetical protein [Paenibacillus sp. CGMCC 1.16610]MVQ33359.1 hypothetical protein [Paenibacillus anseongense]